jgi:anionic cell wall polymer biosynthesis LytR-Cps2A-Psr (LCP) family protein
MKRQALLGRLVKAEKNAAGDKERIARQQSIIAKLQTEGRDTRQAFALLNAYRSLQRHSEVNLERLRKELRSVE